MIKKEDSKSPQDLHEKFHEWFGDSLPAPLPFAAEVDQSIRDPVKAVLPFPPDADYLNLRTRRKVNNPQKLFWL
jgi:hypothetical protein